MGLTLVTDLAELWTDVHGEWPKRSYDAHRDRETGAFRRFAKTCVAAIPERWQPKDSLDWIIRTVCEEGPPPRKTHTLQFTKEGWKMVPLPDPSKYWLG
jgi:hypothetical protein